MRPVGQVAFGDAVATVRLGLIAAGITPLIVAEIPNPRPDEFIHLTRVGGTVALEVFDRAAITADCWAPSLEDAMELGGSVRQQMHRMQGTTVGNVTVGRVIEIAGLSSGTDRGQSEQHRARQSFQIDLRGQ